MNSNKILFGIMIALLLCFPIALAQENTTNDVIDIPVNDTEVLEPILISEPIETDELAVPNDTDVIVETPGVEEEITDGPDISADEGGETEVEIEEIEGLDDAGVTPDSPLYGLERAMERIQFSLTFNKAAKAKMGLAHANERLAEVQAMISEKKMDKAEKAQKLHDKQLEEVEGIVDELGNGDAEEEAEDVAELEQEINDHRMIVEKVGNSLVKVKGQLTGEQQAKVQEMVQAMEGTSAKLKIGIQNKKEESKIKVRLQTGKTDAEIDEQFEEFAAEYELERKGKSGVLSSEKGKSEKEDVTEVEDEEEEVEVEDETETEDIEEVEEDEEKGNGNGSGKDSSDDEEEEES